MLKPLLLPNSMNQRSRPMDQRSRPVDPRPPSAPDSQPMTRTGIRRDGCTGNPGSHVPPPTSSKTLTNTGVASIPMDVMTTFGKHLPRATSRYLDGHQDDSRQMLHSSNAITDGQGHVHLDGCESRVFRGRPCVLSCRLGYKPQRQQRTHKCEGVQGAQS